MARRFNTGYYISEGFHSIFTHGFMSFAAVCMTVACLLIMGSFSLVALNLEHMLGDLEAENELIAYVEEDYTEEQARALQSSLEAIPNVSNVTCTTSCLTRPCGTATTSMWTTSSSWPKPGAPWRAWRGSPWCGAP